MKTSYFAKYKEPNGVSIAKSTPKWFQFTMDMRLVPTWGMIEGIKKGFLSTEDYEIVYREKVLSPLDPWEIYRDHENSVLLCWERIGEFCHRRIVAKWIEENTGHVVEEYGVWK